MSTETWKQIENFQGYEVSNEGRVRSKKCVLKPQKHSGGYQIVSLYIKGKQNIRFVHSLVLTAFVGERPDGYQACHGNGIKTDNRVSNLRWDTPSENQIDRDLQGTGFFGKQRKLTRLTSEKVLEIREKLIANAGNKTKTANQLGLSRTTVADIANGRTWNKK